MHIQYILPIALFGACATATLHDVLAGRQTNNTEEAYLNVVCFPNTTSPVVPPCQEIINIASACLPNGTTPLDYLAHAQCMCGGSFFNDWIGCLDCDYVHGARSGAIVSAFNTIITSASNALCTGTPTASFEAIFSSLSGAVYPSGSATGMTDLYPSQTAISLYYTPSKSQGAGAITGSATGATKVPATTSTTGSSSRTASVASGSGSSSTSSSRAGAAPTGVWLNGLGAIAGGIVLAAL